MSNNSNALTPQEVQQAVDFLKTKVDFPLQLAIVLGSGLGSLADLVKNPTFVPFKQVPNFPVSTVSGHSGQFIFGFIGDVSVALMQGRVHYYEGYHASKVSMGVRVFASLGIKHVLLTNAAGGVNLDFQPGNIMLIEDHINMMSNNPLIGPHFEEWGVRFVDMGDVYDTKLRNLIKSTAKEINVGLKNGIYACMSGPSYETAAEVKMLRTIGVDAAGMSTVPEAIVARQSGMKVMAMSLITNLGAGMVDEDISHDDVMKIAAKSYPDLVKLIENIILELDKEF